MNHLLCFYILQQNLEFVYTFLKKYDKILNILLNITIRKQQIFLSINLEGMI